MSKRLVAVLAVSIVAVLVADAGVLAAGSRTHITTDRPINTQASAWTTARTAGTSAWQQVNWDAVEGANVQVQPQPLVVHATGVVTITVSAAFSGGPVDVRVSEFGQPVRPGVVRFSPQSGNHAFSFTFLHGAPGEACGREFSVDWRLAGTQAAWLNRADVVATYRKDTHDYGPGFCG